MDLNKAISLATAGMKAQSGRMRISAENLANADSTGGKPGADPYRRKIPVFKIIADNDPSSKIFAGTKTDRSEFPTRIDPGHPAANAAGLLKLPNVDPMVEQADLRDAQRSYEANLNVITAARRMISRTIDMLRG